MAKAVRYHKQGGPEVMQVDEVPVGEPGPGEVRIRHTAIGVNFIDTYQRSGLYPMPLPVMARQRRRRAWSRRSARASPTSRPAIASPIPACPARYCEARVDAGRAAGEAARQGIATSRPRR